MRDLQIAPPLVVRMIRLLIFVWPSVAYFIYFIVHFKLFVTRLFLSISLCIFYLVLYMSLCL